jgi:hypothetical protein
MAAGNQEEKGIWALLVINPMIKNIINIFIFLDKIISWVLQECLLI